MKHPLLLSSLAAWALAGCTVYVPTLPTMPLLEEKGQLEATASLHPSPRLEATVAYSPATHLVLSGTGVLGFGRLDQQYLRTRQGELGVGGYWLLGRGQSWLLNTTVGGGVAATRRRDCFIGCDALQGRYGKGFGQVGIAYLGVLGTTSFTYRLSRVQYTDVLDDGVPLADFGSFRHDLGLSVRRTVGYSGNWFVMSTVGMSSSSLPRPGDTYSEVRSDRWYAAGVPALMLGVGVGWQPELKRRQTP